MSDDEQHTSSEPQENHSTTLRGRLSRRLASLGRVRSYGGPEREATLIVVKSALAATIAWYFAQNVFGAQFPAFAPFSAVLMLQVTVYQSVLQSTRFILAIVLGVSLQGVVGLALAPAVWTFAIVTLLALMLGRWRRLGSQGGQVVSAAFFAYAAFLTGTGPVDRLGLLSSLILLVLMGCAIGILVNIVVVPPMRYRSAEYAVENLAKSVHGLIADISESVSQGPPTRGDSDDWRFRGERLENLAERTRDTVDSAAESVRFNPRRLLLNMEPPFGGYRTVVDRLARVSVQLSSIADTLSRTSDDPGLPHSEFLEYYGAFLGHIGEAARLLAELESDRISEHVERLAEHVERARNEQTAITSTTVEQESKLADQTRVYGGLLIDAERLLGEFQYIHTTLVNVVEHPNADPDSVSSEG
ncbi:uncharacterized membrane protein YgaE (UPF0421/DUF939 family) [Lipingzhangella halophila]|uniref:Uncharacterized membrane protein YgaE (UPF0421/DUF939 family) n=1 Tax=Lipingzhangella halophila TaxID=1783352 RepID=A0A7W7RN66_9ACTN|nr:aromatic acid exporter family protein [Lipingzhangella halophila]MBB4935064.1 uncharacterized membrane protein YgaE (UPF0421/DUF939 family) [Lipingzhangella halophila]